MAGEIKYEKRMREWTIRVFVEPEPGGNFTIRTHANGPKEAIHESVEESVSEDKVEARVRARANEMIERIRVLYG